VKIAALALVVNVALALALMPILAHVGIALATAVSAWINAGLLAVLLYRRGLLEPDRRLMTRLVRIFFAALLMAGALWLIADALEAPLRQSDPAGVAALVLLIAVGTAAYAVLAQLLRATSLREMRSMFRRG
jgi:putative peptidoglycan lipid II flippase